MESFCRFIQLIGETSFHILKEKVVLVVGVGGVGSYAVEALIRSGIHHIILLDYDEVDDSNINRQIEALHSTLHQKKIEVLKRRILDINPNCDVILIDQFLTSDNIIMLDTYSIDYIVDACDTLTTKKALIRYALDHQIKFISSMGTGNKFNPSALEITDIRKTSYDPIAKILRRWIRDEGITEKIIVVSSKEQPQSSKCRVPGSTSFVPSSAGLLCASYIINDILKNERS